MLSLIAAKGGKASGGGSGKKGSANTKGVEYDAMGTKWNKSMWDNMESKYSGGHLRFYSTKISFCPSPTNDIPKTNQVPFKSPMKMLPEMQKKI